MKIKTWEEVIDQLQRIRVPGGWLYRSWIGQDTPGSPARSLVMVFVPDEKTSTPIP